ncbi:hypothetical protein AB0B21_01025 [Streptomyces rimosus]|uniref:hypothetical protein n=1 Tax=Streptomyces rimosus TaxID=1927 RepID=UPI000518DAB8|nr:hypothetical protein [Streptomyces rimosus]
MRTYIGHQQVLTTEEFAELAFGFEESPAGLDVDLFRGPLAPETTEQRAARLDVAREVIADLAAEGERGDEVAAWDALYADALMRTTPLLQAVTVAGVFVETGEAA